MTLSLGIDIGGSGIKGAVVDIETGALTTERHRVDTPEGAPPDAVMEIVSDIAAFHGWEGPIGVAVPGVVRRGIVYTAANISDDWIGFDVPAAARTLGHDAIVLNDADAAGIGEVAFGAARGFDGVVLLLTFGTGIGSAIVHDGVLIPNTELGHLEFKGTEAEKYAAARLVKREGHELGWWASRVNELLQHLDLVLAPDTIVFGGGISKRFDEFAGLLDTRARIVPAVLRNNAGIVGAALTAARGVGSTS